MGEENKGGDVTGPPIVLVTSAPVESSPRAAARGLA